MQSLFDYQFIHDPVLFACKMCHPSKTFLNNPCQIFDYLQNIHFEIVKDFSLELFPGENVISV